MRCGVGGVLWATRSRPVHGSTFHRVATCSTRPTAPREGRCKRAEYVRGAPALLASKRLVVDVGRLSVCNRLGRVHEKCKVGGHGTRAPANRGRRDRERRGSGHGGQQPQQRKCRKGEFKLENGIELALDREGEVMDSNLVAGNVETRSHMVVAGPGTSDGYPPRLSLLGTRRLCTLNQQPLCTARPEPEAGTGPSDAARLNTYLYSLVNPRLVSPIYRPGVHSRHAVDAYRLSDPVLCKMQVGTSSSSVLQSRVNAQRVRDDSSGPLSPGGSGSFLPRGLLCPSRNHYMQPRWAAPRQSSSLKTHIRLQSANSYRTCCYLSWITASLQAPCLQTLPLQIGLCCQERDERDTRARDCQDLPQRGGHHRIRTKVTSRLPLLSSAIVCRAAKDSRHVGVCFGVAR